MSMPVLIYDDPTMPLDEKVRRLEGVVNLLLIKARTAGWLAPDEEYPKLEPNEDP